MYKRAFFASTGAPEEVLDIETVDFSSLQEGEVRVKMNMAPINPSDINFVQGVYGIKPVLPSDAGLEGMGIVEESRSSRLNAGDTVIMLSGVGSWAAYMTGKAERFLKIRPDLAPQQAAMLKVNPLTAYRILVGFVSLKPGDWVVQNAANSGVGQCLIQIARVMGLRTINLVRREELVEELKVIGGDVVLLDDENAVAKALEQTGGARPLLASNCVGGDSATRLMDMLAAKGTMVTFGAMSKQSIKVPNKFLIFKRITLAGLWVTEWLNDASDEERAETYAKLADWCADGHLIQPVDSIHPLEKIREAAARAQDDTKSGKVLLDLRN